MENVSDQSNQERLQSYVNDFYRKVDFLFQRRRVTNADGNATINLNDTEIKFVASVFTDNFIDAPDTIEITLVASVIDHANIANDRGVLVVTEHADHDSVYSSLYTICAHNEAVGPFISKDVHRSPIERQANPNGPRGNRFAEIETIHDDAPLDESERDALMAMISKL